MFARCALALAIAGCAADPAPEPEPAPANAEEQLRFALRGEPDAEVVSIASAMESALSMGERLLLGEIDYATTSGPALLQTTYFMHGWGVVGTELVGIAPLHTIEHPPCADVESVLAGWATGAGSILREEIGVTVAGSEHAPAVVLFVSKKTAQTWRVTIDLAFEHGSHCAAVYGPACGLPGGPCCDGGSCTVGTTCLGSQCL